MLLNAGECGYSLTNSDALTDKSYDFVTLAFQDLQKICQYRFVLECVL